MFKKVDSSTRQKNNDNFFQQILRQNARWFLPQHRKKLLQGYFILKKDFMKYKDQYTDLMFL